MTTASKEAFVFFVNEANPIDGLSAEQLRGIYAGAIVNWQALGGNDMPIIAFQRPKNSGSQTIMTRFMGKTPLMPPLQDDVAGGMTAIIEKTSEYRNAPSAIGYSFRFFLTGMNRQPRVKMLAIDGVTPTPDTIASGKYPLTHHLYAMTLKDNQKVMPFVQWMLGEQGQELVEKTGYIRLKNTKR